MTDTIIKGSGNSRSIITVPNALTLYPTHEELMQKWATEGIPIDLLGPYESGVDVLGTMLNKANFLTDSTEQSIWGSAANRTVNAALAQLRSLVSTAQSTANQVTSKAGILIGNVTGSGSATTGITISTSFVPKFIIFEGESRITYSGFAVYPDTTVIPFGSMNGTITWSNSKVSMTGTIVGRSSTYYYAIFG